MLVRVSKKELVCLSTGLSVLFDQINNNPVLRLFPPHSNAYGSVVEGEYLEGVLQELKTKYEYPTCIHRVVEDVWGWGA